MHPFYPIAIFALFLGAALRAEEGWKPLWNGRDLSGWSTWMPRPDRASEVPGMPRGADGKYVEFEWKPITGLFAG
jgi:hypothetical protein